MSDWINWSTFIAFMLGVWLSMFVKGLIGRVRSKAPAVG